MPGYNSPRRGTARILPIFFMYRLFCVFLCIVWVQVCTVLLPPCANQIVVNKYIISYHIIYVVFVHSWRFSLFLSLQLITPRIYQPKTPIYSINLKLKHELKVINFPRRVWFASSVSTDECCERVVVSAPVGSRALKRVMAISSETNYICSSPTLPLTRNLPRWTGIQPNWLEFKPD